MTNNESGENDADGSGNDLVGNAAKSENEFIADNEIERDSLNTLDPDAPPA